MFGLVRVVSIEDVPDGDRGECAVGEGGQEVGCGTQGGADALVPSGGWVPDCDRSDDSVGVGDDANSAAGEVEVAQGGVEVSRQGTVALLWVGQIALMSGSEQSQGVPFSS